MPRRPRGWRSIVALAVLVLWIGGMGLLARRELLKPESQRLAEAALRVQPSSDYYVIERDGQVVGGGSAEVDTTGYGIVTRQHLFGQLVPGDSEQVTLRVRASYSPTLEFGSLRIDVEFESHSMSLLAQRMQDSLLNTSIQGLNGPVENPPIVAHDPLFLPTTVAMPLALMHRPRVGLRTDATIFDPLLQRPRTIPLRITAESLFVVVDSATFDRTRQRWITARRDTVRAWLVVSDENAVRGWIDRAGRVVEATDGRGTRAFRTAYEIAYGNWRIARRQESAGGR